MRFIPLLISALLPTASAQAAETCATQEDILQIKSYVRCQTLTGLHSCAGLDQPTPPLRDQYLDMLKASQDAKETQSIKHNFAFALPLAARFHAEWQAKRKIENPQELFAELTEKEAELAKEVVPYEQDYASLKAQLDKGNIEKAALDKFQEKWKGKAIDQKKVEFQVVSSRLRNLREAIRGAKRVKRREIFDPFFVVGSQGRVDLANIDFMKINSRSVFNDARNLGLLKNARYALIAMQEELESPGASDDFSVEDFREKVAKRIFDQKMKDKSAAKYTVRYAPGEPVPQGGQSFADLSQEDKQYFLSLAGTAALHLQEMTDTREKNLRRYPAHHPGAQSALARSGQLEKDGDLQKFIEWTRQDGAEKDCAPFKALHQKLFAKPKASSLECKPDRFALAVENEDGQSRQMEAQLNGNTKRIRQIHFKKIGGGWAGNVYFDEKGNVKDYNNLFTAKLVVPVKLQLADAASCCQQTGAKLEACLARFNYEAPKSPRAKVRENSDDNQGDPNTESAL